MEGASEKLLTADEWSPLTYAEERSPSSADWGGGAVLPAGLIASPVLSARREDGQRVSDLVKKDIEVHWKAWG